MALEDVKEVNRDPEAIERAVAELVAGFGDRVQCGQAIRAQHVHTTTYMPTQPPDAVVFVQSTLDVQAVVRACAAHRVPVIPFGAGTSLEGGLNAPGGGVCVDLSRMNRVLHVNAEDLDAVVQPGLTREDLNVHLRDTGLFFPIDPGANATLGGMASTRASGTNAVRYGTMAENIKNVTVVLADGSVVKTAQRARKSSAGYDLTHLVIGAEGTLGIITQLTVRLHGIPEAVVSAICSFPDLEAACAATTTCMQAGIPIARIELLDTGCVEAVNLYARLDLPEQPLLLLEFHGTPRGVEEQAGQFGEFARMVGGSAFRWVDKPEDRARLWKARHEVYFAMQTVVPGKRPIPNDACVPISRLAECVRETATDIAAADLYGPMLGHVGDGNFHIALYVDPDDPDEIARAEGVLERLSERAIAMDGTCTGEHGIGQGKRRFMRREHGAGVDMMAAVKRALDPHNIMNPGKVLPD